MSSSSDIIWRNAVPVPWPQIGLADVERGGVVLVDDDPRIELPEVGIGIRARRLRRCASAAIASSDSALKLTTSMPEVLRKSRAIGRSCHHLRCAGSDLAALGHAIAFAARLMAAWMR